MMRPRNISGAARAGAVTRDSALRGVDDFRVTAHAEVVVRAPDRDLAGRSLLAFRSPERHGEACSIALEVGESPITAFRFQPRYRALETLLVVHRRIPHFALQSRCFYIDWPTGEPTRRG